MEIIMKNFFSFFLALISGFNKKKRKLRATRISLSFCAAWGDLAITHKKDWETFMQIIIMGPSLE